MASVYPGSLDTLATNKADGTSMATDHAAHHNDIADAVNKVESELGVNPSGAAATVAARLDALATDLSNKQPLDADLTAVAGIATTGILKRTGTSTWATITDNSTNWDTAYTDRNKWDGGSAGLTASTGRASLGATTVGSNIFTLTNPSAVTYVRIAADNTVSAASAATVKSDLSLGNVENTALSTWAGSTNLTTAGALSATSLTASSFARFGAQNTTSLPASSATGGVHVSWNRSAGGGEMNFANLYDAATSSFEFIQKTGTSTASRVYQLGTSDHIFYTGDTERMRIDSAGDVGIGNNAPAHKLDVSGHTRLNGTVGIGATVYSSAYDLAIENDTLLTGIIINKTSASFAADFVNLRMGRAATNTVDYLIGTSGGAADTEFRIRGDGSILSDVAATTPADYAEYFEWQDGNPVGENRNGYSVALAGDGKIRFATVQDGDQIIGIVSSRPAVVADTAWSRWQGKYIVNDLGEPVVGEYRWWSWEYGDPDPETGLRQQVRYTDANLPEGIVIPEDAETGSEYGQLISSDYDPLVKYVPREQRPEWSPVGMVGKLRMHKGQPVNPRWIKLREISPDVEEWLVR